MLQVTTAARTRLLEKLERREGEEDETMRFTRKKKGWELGPGKERPDDTTFSLKGRVVLVLDETAHQSMKDMTLDVTRTDSGPKLKLRRTGNAGE